MEMTQYELAGDHVDDAHESWQRESERVRGGGLIICAQKGEDEKSGLSAAVLQNIPIRVSSSSVSISISSTGIRGFPLTSHASTHSAHSFLKSREQNACKGDTHPSRHSVGSAP